MNKKQKITIIGLGHVGLPLLVLCTDKKLDVRGYDINSKRIKKIKDKKVVIDDFYAAETFKNIELTVSDKLKSSDIYVICVPTPIDERNQPDLNLILSAVKSIIEALEDDQLIIIESTIYPGLCEDKIMPLLEESGKNYLLAHCPERINPGDKKWNVKNIPRVVGGVTEEATKRTGELYRSIIDADVMELSSIKNAESTKILENIFRDVNIALVNEMAQSFFRMGIDTIEVINAAATKPFSFLPHFPGIGVGGHCIAVDPYYMIEKGRAAGFDHELLRIARKINSNMPIYSVYMLQNTFNQLGMALKDRKIGVYGLAYKPNVKDARESPSFEIIKRLKELKGAKVIVYDPLFPEMSDAKDMDEFLDKCEGLIICTAHDEIISINHKIFKEKNIKVILDGRNCLNKEKIKKMGITYKGIGRL